jgi:flagellar motor switch protein FliN/FliY
MTQSSDQDFAAGMPGADSAVDQRPRDAAEAAQALGMLSDVEVLATVELGRTQMLVRDILRLHRGAVIELDKLVGQPADMLVNNMPFARGEVIVINGRFGFRVTKFVNPSNT